MKPHTARRSRTYGLFLAIAAFLSTLPGMVAHGQSPPDRPRLTNTDIILAEGRRQTLLNIVQHLQGISAAVGMVDNHPLTVLEAEIHAATPEHLHSLREVDNELDFCHQQLVNAHALLSQPGPQRAVVREIVRAAPNGPEMFSHWPELGSIGPSGSYNIFCAPGTPATSAWFTATILQNVFQVVQVIANRICGQTILGFNAAVVCIITDSLRATMENIVAWMDWCYTDETMVHDRLTYDRLDWLRSKFFGGDNLTAGLMVELSGGFVEINEVVADMAENVQIVVEALIPSDPNEPSISDRLDNIEDLLQQRFVALTQQLSAARLQLDTQLIHAKQNVILGNMAVEDQRIAHCDVIRLLHTPQGQRQSAVPTCNDQPGWPYAWNQLWRR
jgi:hypothetical protein